MATLLSPRHKFRPRLEIIPFIDIMFFLLATFIMVSMTMVQNQGIDLKLPTAVASNPVRETPKRMTISVKESGEIFLEKEAISKEALSLKMAEIKKTAPDTQIVLQGDFGCDFGKVVEIFDEARSHGLVKLILRTKRPPGQEAR